MREPFGSQPGTMMRFLLKRRNSFLCFAVYAVCEEVGEISHCLLQGVGKNISPTKRRCHQQKTRLAKLHPCQLF
ncbi:hypothetical protein TNCV_5104801 [Trichonephila clavipes]|nr:hypothetical protein TNCV_5104801 [Trichonephila clavipes]